MGRALSQPPIPQFVGASFAEAASTGVTVNYHGSAVRDDLLYMFACFGTGAGATPSGWALLDSRNAGPLSYHYRTFWRTSQGETSVALTGGSGAICGGVAVYRGAKCVPTGSTIGVAAGGTIPINGITTKFGNSIIPMWMIDREPYAPDNPSGWTDRYNVTNSFWGARLSDRVYAYGASTGTVNAVQSSVGPNWDGAGMMIEINAGG